MGDPIVCELMDATPVLNECGVKGVTELTCVENVHARNDTMHRPTIRRATQQNIS
jgi:hypothetical protein